MKTKFLCLFVMFSVLFIPFNVKAECDYQRKADLMKMASNVQINNSYVLDDNNHPKFSIHVTNITDDIVVRDEFNKPVNNDSEIKLSSGGTFRFYIYSNDVNCSEELLLSKSKMVIDYNYLSDADECKRNPEFKYCKIWGHFDVSDDKFTEEYNKYINKSLNVVETSSDNFWDSILENLNGILIFALIIVLFTVGVVLFFRKKKN